MKIIKTILTALIALTSLDASAIQENVKIDGDHGKLDAIIQTPLLNKGQKVNMVIICHGFMSYKNDPLLTSLADSLESRGIASIRFDFNGHGNSEGRFQDMTVPNEITDAAKVLEYASSLDYVEKIGVAGHSQGGVVTVMLAGQQGIDKITAIALMAPAAALRDDALRGSTFGKMYDPQNPPEEIELMGGKKLGGNYVRTAVDLPIYETAMKYYGKAYIVHGRADRLVPYTYGERFKEQMRHAEFHLMEGMDHGFSHHQAEVAHMVAEYFKDALSETEAEKPQVKIKKKKNSKYDKEDGLASLFRNKKYSKNHAPAPEGAEDLGGGYARDSKHAYYEGKIIPTAQSGKNFEYKGDGYATDGVNTYYKGKIVDRN